MSVSIRRERTFHLFHWRSLREIVKMRWDVPRDLTKDESDFVRTLRRRSNFYVFLRQIRHLLVDEPFEQALGTAYSDKPRGVGA